MITGAEEYQVYYEKPADTAGSDSGTNIEGTDAIEAESSTEKVSDTAEETQTAASDTKDEGANMGVVIVIVVVCVGIVAAAGYFVIRKKKS